MATALLLRQTLVRSGPKSLARGGSFLLESYELGDGIVEEAKKL